MIRFIDLFCGIGGFRLGLERANGRTNRRGQEDPPQETAGRQGLVSAKRETDSDPKGQQDWSTNGQSDDREFHCIWSCDIDKYARQIYEKNFKEEPSGDIRTVQPEEIPDAELCTFGWPCQDNSIAGKRKGQGTDTRSGLLFEAVKVLRIKKPKYFIAENVPGLFSVNEGCDFYATIRMFTNAGYDCQWQVLNTRWFLPQNRERIFFVGHLRGAHRPKVFPIGENDKDGLRGNQTESWGEVGATLTRKSASGQNARGNYVIYGSSQDQKISDIGGVSQPLSAGHFNQPKIANAVDCDGYLRSGERPRDKDGKPQLLPIGYRRIRRLTPIECERLQGFPDNWTAGVSDTQRYKLLGNAVTVNVIECLAQRLAQGVLGLTRPDERRKAEGK